jgi:hypothetical protein
MNDLDSSSHHVTDGPLQVQEAEGDLAKQAANPQSTPGTGQPASDVVTTATKVDTVVAQFSVLFDGEQEKFDRLWAMRDCMHRVLNTAISEWHRAEKVPSKSNPDKETLDRGSVTESVKALLQRERDYWAAQLPKAQAEVEKARAKKDEDGLTVAQRKCDSVRIKAETRMPSSVYDSAVRYTQGRYALYKKDAFRGDRSSDTYRSGAPIRWRDGCWEFVPSEKKGRYALTLELHKEGSRIERGTFEVIPDGPSMYGYAKQMADGTAKLCDARLIYVEKKKQWFAKLTIQVTRKASAVAGSRVASLRQGVANAFVLVFEDGFTKMVEGGDVLAFKRRIKARKVSLSKHLGKRGLTVGSRGRGKKRRFQGLRKIDDAEDRFIDNRCKTWACALAAECVDRKVGKLLVAKMGPTLANESELGPVVSALLYQWPFARMLDRMRQAFAKVPVDAAGRAVRGKIEDDDDGKIVCADRGREPVGYVAVEIEEYSPAYDARRCPDCKHKHAARQSGLFTCEVCGFKRPADTIVAWNGLLDAVGKEPLEKSKEAKKKATKAIKKALGRTSHAE